MYLNKQKLTVISFIYVARGRNRWIFRAVARTRNSKLEAGGKLGGHVCVKSARNQPKIQVWPTTAVGFWTLWSVYLFSQLWRHLSKQIHVSLTQPDSMELSTRNNNEAK